MSLSFKKPFDNTIKQDCSLCRVESDGELVALPDYPGLQIHYSTDGGEEWQEYEPGLKLSGQTTVTLETR